MRKRRFTEEQITGFLWQAEAGRALAHAVFEHKSLDNHLAMLRGQSFQSTTSLGAWCMSARSAYIRLSLAFTSCS